MFIIESFAAPELGNASFLVADPNRGVAAAVDPFRDVDRYVSWAQQEGLRLVRTFDTHVHNDFVSGSPELHAATGAAIDPLLADSSWNLGDIEIRALSTPGHTPDHKSYLLVESGRPRVLFSGGAVMVGGVARTDLFGPQNAVGLALQMYRTLHERLRWLPDDLAVCPTHGSGSFCGVAGGEGHQTTLGAERANNPYFQATELMPFLVRILDQHRYPAYYAEAARLNREGAPLLGPTPYETTVYSPDDVARALNEGAAIIDIRQGREYDEGHIAGSYSIPLGPGPFSAWTGWLVSHERDMVLVGASRRDCLEGMRQLSRIGYDRVVGMMVNGMDDWLASGRGVSTFETASIDDLTNWILSGERMTLLDARDDREWAAGHAPGAVHIYLPDIPARASEIPLDAPVAVYCAAGYRAGIATSLLEQAGLKRVIHISAQFEDWANAHLAKEVAV